MMIGFETQRDKVERMKEMIYKELDRSQHELFTQEELTPILVSIKLSPARKRTRISASTIG